MFKKKISNLPYFDQWILMYNQGKSISKAFSNFKKIIPPKDRFWADPFVIFKDNRYYIFFEEFIYSEKKGHISLVEIDLKGNYSKPKKILERSYHLSYPFIFEFEDNLYFIHGTIFENKSSVELFRCTEFPYKWEYLKDLIIEIPVVDTTIFYHQNKWWLFACQANLDGTSSSSDLLLFFSENPLDEKWTSHPKNPIVSDLSKARPAGKIFEFDGKLIRPAQNCTKSYGYGMVFNEITKLTDNDYSERIIDSFEPDWDKSVRGIHTFNHDNKITIIDARLRRRRFI